ncbi:MAG: hemolysin III family protein [Parcubacteria group bacterium]|nr:hemolysin III family protein [Parcubacteria group bacterium]
MRISQKSLLHYRFELINTLTHGIGAMLAVAALALLVVYASLYGTVWHVVSFSVFGTGLTLLYIASTLYHAVPFENRAKSIFKKLDHAMIYVLIAATYTPVCLVAIRGGWGWSLFGVIWGLALAGVLVKTLNVSMPGWLSGVIYLAMGWLDIIAYVPMNTALSSTAFQWLFAGGVLYSIGALFFALDKIVPRRAWFGMHEIFHVFVLLGSASHFWFLFHYLLYV